MAKLIPQELIDDVRSANDIVDVISERIPVKKAGRNYRALCPFHNEKTPSFNINPERQIYHCFGCGVGGNVISFVMEYDKVGFLDAVRELASRAGIRLPERSGRYRDEAEDPIYETNARTVRHFQRALASERGAAARDYCRARGLGDDVVEEFRLGFAPPGWDGLIKAAGADGVRPQALLEAGLVVERDDGGHYDRFRDRLIFPLLLSNGRVVGFGGRALGDQEPKYLNSPETRVYRKSHYLYGLAQARLALRSTREAILVEGYTDLLSLHQAGFTNTVASAGTAFTRDQAKTLSRYADKVFLVYDGDSAGIQAATRAAEELVRLGLKMRIVALPDDADPDSYVRERGADALRQELERSLDFIDFFVAANPVELPEEREGAARRLIETVVQLEDPLKADLMLEKIAEALSVSRGAVARVYEARMDEIRKRGRRAKPDAQPEESAARPTKGSDAIRSATLTAERGLVAILLRGGDGARSVADALTPSDFADPTLREIAGKVLEAGAPDEPVDVSALVGDTEDRVVRALVTELSMEPEGVAEDGGRLCGDYIRTVRRSKIEAEIRAVERLIRSAELTDDQDALLDKVALRQELARQLTELSTD